MIRSLAYYGNPILRKKGAKITEINDEIKTLVQDMVETLEAHDGIGLAAPQVNQSIALFITCIGKLGPDKKKIKGKLRVFINPKIIAHSKEETVMTEGCLSIPNTYIEISRPKAVTVEAMDLDGNTFTEEFFDLEAHCILHENDHINGVLHVDRFRGKNRNRLDKQLREIKKKYAEAEKNTKN